MGILDGILGAVTSPVASIIGTAASLFGAGQQQDFAAQQAQQAQGFSAAQVQQQEDFQAQQADISRNYNTAATKQLEDWQYWMSGSSYQRATQDMKNAGINPMLAYMQGGAPGGSGGAAIASPTPQGASASGIQAPAINRYAAAVNTGSTLAQMDLMASEAEKNRAVARLTDTTERGYQGEQNARIANIRQATELANSQTNLNDQSARLVWQNVNNAVLNGEKIKADTGNAEADTALKKIQTALEGQKMPEAKAWAAFWQSEAGKNAPGSLTAGKAGVTGTVLGVIPQISSALKGALTPSGDTSKGDPYHEPIGTH